MKSNKNNPAHALDRLLIERLEQFKVPTEVRLELLDDILAFFQRPKSKPFGATVMTAAASVAADQAREEKKVQPPGGHTPEII